LQPPRQQHDQHHLHHHHQQHHSQLQQQQQPLALKEPVKDLSTSPAENQTGAAPGEPGQTDPGACVHVCVMCACVYVCTCMCVSGCVVVSVRV
jgi:hypothetical protein